jgi:hypothetical protein
MYCPVCKDEFRSGFTRCANCDVDLVEDLSAAPKKPEPSRSDAARPALVPMVDYCGFFSLDDARGAREQLREQGISSEITIRDAPGSTEEEYWLRVEPANLIRARATLGVDEVAEEDQSFLCADCGKEVAAHEEQCPGCGARFDDD